MLKAFHIDFNWYHLASWINITEQWPYRASWLILFYEANEDTLDDKCSLKDLFEKWVVIFFIMPNKGIYCFTLCVCYPRQGFINRLHMFMLQNQEPGSKLQGSWASLGDGQRGKEIWNLSLYAQKFLTCIRPQSLPSIHH